MGFALPSPPSVLTIKSNNPHPKTLIFPLPLSHTQKDSTMPSAPLPPTEIIKKRWLGFLIWQSIASSAIYLFLTPPLVSFSLIPSPLSLLSFLLFSLSLLLLSLALFLISSPHPDPAASPPLLFSFLLKSLLKSVLGGFSNPTDTPNVRRRVRRSLASAAFLTVCCVSGFLSVAAVCGRCGSLEVASLQLVGSGLWGLVLGSVYGLEFVCRRRWILRFPILQRPLFYSFKRDLLSSVKQALRLSTVAFCCSTVLMIFLSDQFKRKSTVRQNVIQLFCFYIGTSSVSICWELSHHLLQVVHTRRFSFAPPQGSAAAETNPSEVLLEALEQSSPRSLLQYLAYLDLCMVSESNVEPWCRAAFFEETGETYRRVISVCLRPLEQLTSRIGDGLEGLSLDKSDLLALQLNAPADTHLDLNLQEAFSDLQLCTWCARTVSALTARSHREDRYGIAQLTGCNTVVVSTLLSSLIAVEACLGKKTNTQAAHLMGPANIQWVTANTGKRDAPTVVPSKKRGSALYDKAYAMADVLRTSIYQIVSAFQADMQTTVKHSELERNWIGDGKPLYSTREILVQKLVLFLEFRAN